MNQFQYAVKISRSDEGGFVVTCRDLPQLITQGDDLQHALSEAADAMDEVFAAYIKAGLVFPPSTKVRLVSIWFPRPQTRLPKQLCISP